MPGAKPRPRQPPEGLDILDPGSGIAIFTDGSAHPKTRQGGWAWIAVDLNDREAFAYGGDSGVTNNQMEMQAWIEALEALYETHGACEVLLFSDSQYVGLGAMDRNRQRVRNLDRWAALDVAMDRHVYVEFVHVRGHSGDEYNELADQLANEARRLS